ncbi:MAG: phosphotransferase [Pseudomonadota bacterium]
MNDNDRRQYSIDLDIDLKSLDLIKENKYCIIYVAATPDGRRIVKKYKGEDSSLVKIEADALIFYHELAQNDSDLMDSGIPLLRQGRNLLCIGFIDGEAFSDVLYKARKDDAIRDKSIRLMRKLGRVIRTIYDKTRKPGAKTSPFIFEYLDYCSNQLHKMPILGSTFFKRMPTDSKQIAEEFERSNIEPSFIHGDLVFKNIHIKGERLGLIDFANANSLSHPLNDIYNLRFALSNMLLPQTFKTKLLEGFNLGTGQFDFPPAARRFYYEYHRRRWLMLKLSSKNPVDFLQGVRGLMSFARNSAPEAVMQ